MSLKYEPASEPLHISVTTAKSQTINPKLYTPNPNPQPHWVTSITEETLSPPID